MLRIPDISSKKWVQSNKSDLFGNVVETKNIDFSSKGYLKLSYAPKATITEDVTNWDRPSVIIFNGDISEYFIDTWDEPFSADSEILSFTPTEITDTDSPSGAIASDAAWFDQKLAVTESTDLHYYDAPTNTWIDTNVSLSNATTVQHPVVNFLSKAALAVANINTVNLYSALSATPTLLTTLTIPADFIISSMKYYNQNLYIGTRHKYGGDAAMYIWNGEGTAAQNVIEAKGSNIIHDICVFQESVVAYLSNGSLQMVAGSSFQFLDAFPLFYTERVTVDKNNVNSYHNCMRATEKEIYISFSDNDNQRTQMINQPAGVWCYDPEVGLYNKYSFSIAVTYKIDSPVIDTTNNEIPVTKVIPTGTEVYYKASTATPPLVEETKYYAIYVSATRIKLATTRANAFAGTYIDLQAGGVSDYFTFFFKTDYGQIIADRPSAITTIDYTQQRPEYGVDVIWSSDLATRNMSTTSQSYLGSVSTGVEARGYFVTPKIFSSEVTDTFNLFTIKFGRFLTEHDKIIIKYRMIDDERDTINIVNKWEITWTSSTTFTTTESEWSGAQVGDEVMFLQGAGGGLMAHITAISYNAGTYTITIDETFEDYTAGDAGLAVFRNWKKWQTISYGDIDATRGYFSKQLGKTGKMIQFKIELRGIRVKIEEVTLDNIYKLSAKNSGSRQLIRQ